MPSVPQTSVIFFALLVGFVVFITLRGELAGYLYVIGLGGGSPSIGGGAVPSVAAPTTTTGQVPGTGGLPSGTTINPDGSMCVDGRCSVMVPIRGGRRAL
jgi:hypothetical protein